MHNSLKILVSACILITICGCSDGGKLKYDVKTIHRETEEYSINGEIIELEGDSGGTADFNAQISNEADGWSEDFITRVMDVAIKSDVLPKLQFRNVVKYNKTVYSV